MRCRHCGTEIADKAIICYRCGAGTSDPVRQPARIQGRRGRLLYFVVLVLLILLGLFLGRAGQTVVPLNDTDRLVAVAAVVVAVGIVLARMVRRRARRR